MVQTLDYLGVIFPFEVDCFEDTELPVEFVGHPFIHPEHKLPLRYDAAAPVLLLPGSRTAAVGRIFPVLLDGFRLAKQKKPELKARVIYPSQKIWNILDEVIEDYSDLAESLEFVEKSDRTVSGSAVLMSSGTMSLTCALAGMPGAIVYRLNAISYWLGRLLVKIPYIGIANLLLKQPMHPEFIQGAAKPKQLAEQLLNALDNPQVAQAAKAGATELKELLSVESSVDASEWLMRNMQPLADRNVFDETNK